MCNTYSSKKNVVVVFFTFYKCLLEIMYVFCTVLFSRVGLYMLINPHCALSLQLVLSIPSSLSLRLQLDVPSISSRIMTAKGFHNTLMCCYKLCLEMFHNADKGARTCISFTFFTTLLKNCSLSNIKLEQNEVLLVGISQYYFTSPTCSAYILRF